MPNILVYEGVALHRRIDEGQPIDIEYLVSQLHLYLDSFVQTPPYNLVASSLGGKVVIEYAVRHPENVNRIVLLCPSGMGDEERLPIVEGVRRNDMQALIDSVFSDRRLVDPNIVNYYRRVFTTKRWRTGFLRTVRGTMEHCVRDRLSEVKHPTLLVSGQDDRIVDPNQAEAAAKLLPQGQYICIPQCGHAPQMEKPKIVNRLVVDFLTSSVPAAPNRRLSEMMLAKTATVTG
jgi:pimeloyl-ACP methyl ester carboxylesterase